jgi:metabolite-proton symporter
VDRRRQLRRAGLASAVGAVIELYDFFLFGVAAALVFPARFFPEVDPDIGRLLAFSTFFVGFVARPLGAAIFGHFGDRIGRKASLIATLILMGVATTGIGLAPDYESIGIWGALILVLGRVLQGIGVGGEWGGAVLIATEWGHAKRRGFIGSWTQWGAPVGLLLANGALSLMADLTGDAFLTWGWRVPFLLSALLVVIGLVIRKGIDETPPFSRVVARGEVKKMPVVEVVRAHWRNIGLIALLRTGDQVTFYIFTTYVLTYLTGTLQLPRKTALDFVMIAAAASTISIPVFGLLSDRIGRRRMLAIGYSAMLVWPFVYFFLLDTKEAPLILLAIVLGKVIHDLEYAPQAAVIAESFPSDLRYSGISLGFQLASITAGGPAPFIAIWLLGTFHTSTAIAAYISVASLISLIALRILSRRPTHEVEV